ncbi:MAG: hypothetical protein JXA37_13270, partial [Chloroflexia bacterium]|nr:hypothetical protein [Chloroflexia bacterium]
GAFRAGGIRVFVLHSWMAIGFTAGGLSSYQQSTTPSSTPDWLRIDDPHPGIKRGAIADRPLAPALQTNADDELALLACL